jgi:hypothetical protein
VGLWKGRPLVAQALVGRKAVHVAELCVDRDHFELGGGHQRGRDRRPQIAGKHCQRAVNGAGRGEAGPELVGVAGESAREIRASTQARTQDAALATATLTRRPAFPISATERDLPTT